MSVAVIAIYRDHRETGNQLQGLAKDIADGDILRRCIIGIEGQNTLLQDIHHVGIRGIHDDIANKVIRQIPVVAENFQEFFQLLRIRQGTKQQKISDLLKTKAAAGAAFDQIIDIVALKI